MKRSALLFFIGITLSVACNNNTPKTNSATGGTDTPGIRQLAQQLNEYLKKMDVPSQIFNAPADKLSMITGKKGTVVFIAPGDLETESGDKPEKNIVVELKEITNQGDLLRANTQTTSNGQLLVSGGAYYLKMTSGDKQLRIKKDKTLKVAFPRISDSAMTLFYGNRDSAEHLNWQPTNQKLISKNGYSMDTTDTKSIMVYDERDYHLMGYVGNDSTFRRDTAMLNLMRRNQVATRIAKSRLIDSVNKVKQRISQKLNSTLYDIAEINKLGWINCDRFPQGTARTNITYTIAPKDSVSFAHVYLVFNEFNSMVNNTYYAIDGGSTRDFGNIPIGYKARLIAVTYKKNQLFTCKMDITTAENQHTLIIWKPAAEADLKKLFDVNDNR